MNPRSEGDQAFLDRCLERALFEIEERRPVSVDELIEGREHLRGSVEEIVHLARRVADGDVAPSALSLPGYEIVRELGRGGMGTVYLARQERLGERLVALKVLPPSLALSSRARERFRVEVIGVARLHHPHIVRVHDLVEGSGVLAFSMDWVDGKSLAAIIDALADAGRPPTTADLRVALGAAPGAFEGTTVTVFLCRLGIAMGRALAAVHRAGLLHRDVKPSNVLVRRDGAPFLSDFGLVRDTEAPRESRTGAFVGTPAYAAPEQLRGERVLNERTDVYALGATLYHALTLRPPFSGRTAAEMLRLLEAGAAPPIRKISPHLPVDLETIVSKALALEPERRYGNADEVADDLERLLALEPIRARPPSAAYHIRVFFRRHTAAVIAAAIAWLALVAATIISFASARSARDERDRSTAALARESEALASARVSAKKQEEIAWLLRAYVAGANPRAVGRSQMTVREALERAEHLQVVEQRRLEPDIESAVRMEMAQLHLDLGLLDSAARHVERAIALQRSDPGESSNDFLQSLQVLGRIHGRQNRPDLALAVQERIVAERRRRPESEAQFLAQALVSEAISLRRLERFREAEVVNREAMSIYARRIDPKDENVGIVANNLARLLSVQGRHDEALELGKRAVSILEQFHGGRNHLGVTEAEFRLGMVLARAGEVDAGVAMARQALAQERSLVDGPRRERADKLSDLASFLAEAGRLDEALAVEKEAVENLLAFEPDASATVIWEEEACCRILRLRGDLAAAEARCREIIARQGDAGATSGIWRELGAVLCVGERYDEAEESLRKALEDRPAWRPGMRADRAETAAWLARTCAALEPLRPGEGYAEAAARWKEEASR